MKVCWGRDATELSKQRVLEKHSRVWLQSNWTVYFRGPQAPVTIPYILCHLLRLLLGSGLAEKSPKGPETRAPVAIFFLVLPVLRAFSACGNVRQPALPWKFYFRILPGHDALMMMTFSEWEGMVVQRWVKMVLIVLLLSRLCAGIRAVVKILLV